MLSVSFYESDEKIDETTLRKLDNYGDDKENLSEVSILLKQIIVGRDKYRIFRIGKKVKKIVQMYTVDEEDKIIPVEEETQGWEDTYAYIKVDSNDLFVSGSGAGWVGGFISRVLFGSENKIKLTEIDTKKLEEDIRKSRKFTPIGTSFVDPDQTRVTIKNSGGIDLDTNRHTKDIAELEKSHIDIIIQAEDDLNFNVFVYPTGKITFQGYIRDKEAALRIFLKIWAEIKEYS